MTTRYRLMGRSGLRVAPLGLGTMTFGQADWGCDESVAGQILDAYLGWGGNVVDTADIYAGGESERIIGRYLTDRLVRDDVVLVTKYSMGARPGRPNAGGNGRVALRRSLEGSLGRLGADHVDVLMLHAWDGVTPVEEVARALDEVVRAGLVRHVALSDVPAWFAARIATIAQWRGYEPPIAVQLEYSLAERGLEHEFPGLCREVGLGLMTWGPLANGLLAGAYSGVASADDPETAELPPGRIRSTSARRNPATDKRNDRTWAVVRELDAISGELGASPAQVAVAWLLHRPAVTTVLLGARRVEQLEQTLSAADLELPADARARLDELGVLPRTVPYGFMPWAQSQMNADLEVGTR